MSQFNLVIHAGYGKTGTTWLQQNIFPNIPDCIYFGKYPEKNDLLFDKTLHKRFYQLFNPLYSIKNYRSRNSHMLIKLLAQEISNAVLKKSENVNSAILSNESILAYGNYNGELNAYLLFRLTQLIKENLSESLDLNVVIICTIREQSSWLQSFYAYDFARQSKEFDSFSDYLEYGLSHPRSREFGGLWYDEIFLVLTQLFKNNVFFIPFELLKESPIRFLEYFIRPVGNPMSIESIEYTLLAQQASNQNSSSKGNYLREYSVKSKMAQYLLTLLNHRSAKNLGSTKPHFLAKFLEAHANNLVKKRSIKIDPEYKAKISKLYSESNSQLEKLIDMNLSELGYSTSIL